MRFARHHRDNQLTAALVRHMQHAGVAHAVKQCAGQMAGRSVAGRTHQQVARSGLGQGSQFLHVFHRQRWMHRGNIVELRYQRHRDKVADCVITGLGVHRRTDHHRHRAANIDHITVGGRLRCRLGANQRTGAAAVIDHHLLADGLTQTLRKCARHHIGAAAGGPRHDETDRFARVRLRQCSRYAAQRQHCHHRQTPGQHGCSFFCIDFYRFRPSARVPQRHNGPAARSVRGRRVIPRAAPPSPAAAARARDRRPYRSDRPRP